VKERVSANAKLGRTEAIELAKEAGKMTISRGTKVLEFAPGGRPTAEMVDAMLGSTGNLRAPCIRRGKTLLIGFNEEVFQASLK
jgi:hypothetical protein